MTLRASTRKRRLVASSFTIGYTPLPLAFELCTGVCLLKLVLSAVALATLLFTGQAANAQSWVVELNGAKVDDLSGAELGLGYNFAKKGFRLTPIVGALIYQGDNDRYRSETVSGGRKICRDLSNGQFSDKDNCNNTAAKAYGKLEAAYRFKSIELGGGVRISDETMPYGTVAAYVGDNLAVKGFGGKDYYGAGLAFTF